MENLTEFPASVLSGDSLGMLISLSDYLASDSWELTYTLINSSAKITMTASASGDDHLFAIAAATTAAYGAGTYDYQGTVAKGSDRYTVDSGIVEILPDLTAATTYDNRSHAKQTLDALEATILGKASKDQISYSIAGRSIARMTPDELRSWRKEYKAEYRREQVAAGNVSSRRIIYPRFSRLT